MIPKIDYESLNYRLDISEHIVLFPGDVVILKHYNGCSIKFNSPGFCKLVYHGGFGFDIIPINHNPREISVTLIEPPLKLIFSHGQGRDE